MPQPRILVVDDEVSIRKSLAALLRSHGYQVELSATGREAVDAVALHAPDLVILDLGLPDVPGLEVCREIRATSTLPIIVLSARAGESDKIAALDTGADDYLTKPFGPGELLARLRAALRRQPAGQASGQIAAGDLVVDFDRRRAMRTGQEIRLTPKEFELLALVARQAGRVVTHRTILRTIWGPHAVRQPEHLWVLVAQLRRKIEPDPAHPRYLVTEPWVGYRLVAEPSE